MKHLQKAAVKDLTSGSLVRNFVVFAAPLVLAGLLSQAFNLLDLVIAGRFLGEQGVAAVGATSSLITFYSSVFWGFGSGFAIFVAHLFGARQYPDIRRAIRTNLAVMLIGGIVLSCGLLLFREQLFDLLRVKPEIRQDAMRYFAIVLAGGILPAMNNTCIHILNAMGCSSFPFFVSLIVAVCNISGNILTVAMWGMGVAGLAIATLFSAAVGLLCYLCKIHSCLRSLGLANERFALDAHSLTMAFRYSLPNMAQQTVMYTAGLLISGIVNNISVSATAAYAVATQVYDVSANVYQNSSKTVSNYVAQCNGAGKVRQIPKGLLWGLVQGLAFVALPLSISCIFGEVVCGLFFQQKGSAEAVALAMLFTSRYLPFLELNLLNNLFHAFFRGMGSRVWLLLATTLGAVVRVLSSFLLAKVNGMEGVYLGWVISWAVEAMFSVCVYFLFYHKKLRTGQEMYL